MPANLLKLKTDIQSGAIQEAGQALLTLAQDRSSRFTNEIIGQLSSLKQVLADERKGISSPESIKVQKNRITYALLDIIDEMDEEISLKKPAKAVKKSHDHDNGVVFDGPVGQVIIQQSKSGDNVVEKKEKVIEIGAYAKISAPVLIADSIENSFNALAKSAIDDETKALLEKLLHTITDINKQSTGETTELAESLARDAENLVKEATSSKPRHKWYEVSIDGLKQAALNLGEVATPVLEIIGKLTPLLLG